MSSSDGGGAASSAGVTVTTASPGVSSVAGAGPFNRGSAPSATAALLESRCRLELSLIIEASARFDPFFADALPFTADAGDLGSGRFLKTPAS
mmetsp:Transcript_25734/g.86478  ORF Transcript_25734/g.86478 Transcript_25734/m.86478 type:complete len:93 (-) Transcript_25734:14-292(-)